MKIKTDDKEIQEHIIPLKKEFEDFIKEYENE